jgi:beta-lactam-binding protein with PASTA domain
MAFNNMNLFLSLAILQNKGIDRDKMLAASVGAALVPGILGLAVPLIVASNEASTTTGTGTSTGTADTTGDVPTQTKVPDVQTKTEQEAIDAITAAGLNPVVTRAFFTAVAGSKIPDKGTVARQDPKPSDDWVDSGSDVRIEVSLGEATASTTDDATIDRSILALDKDMQQKMSDMGAKVDQILTKVGSWNTGSNPAGAPKH